MPTADRRLRPKRANGLSAAPIATESQFQSLIRDAVSDPEAWRAVRPRCVRYLLARSSKLDGEQAARIADAFWRRPQYLPTLPPRDAVE